MPVYSLRTQADRDRITTQILDRLDLAKPWEVEVRRPKARRSLSANALYWSWLSVISDETGHTPDELHEFFKLQFAVPVAIEIAGQTIEHRSTARMTKEQMSAYMQRVEQFANSQLGVYLPAEGM